MILYVVLFVYIFLKNQNSFFIKKLKKIVKKFTFCELYFLKLICIIFIYHLISFYKYSIYFF